MVDIESLLRQKMDAVVKTFQSANQQILEHAQSRIEAELAKGPEADFSELQGELNDVLAYLFPHRHAQIERHLSEGTAGKRILAVYDFIGMPYSFNFLVFLFIAERYRNDIGADKIDVALIAHDSDPGVMFDDIYGDIQKRYRTLIQNVIFPSLELLQSVGGVQFFDNRQLFNNYLDATSESHTLFPPYYSKEAPNYNFGAGQPYTFSFINLIGDSPDRDLTLDPPGEMVEIAQKWLKQNCDGRIPVTITLRSASYEHGKNTNIRNLGEAINTLDYPDICFIVVPDYYRVFEEETELENATYCHEAALSLAFRAALYRAASFNIFQNNGPACIGYLSRTIRYLFFEISVESETSATLEHLETNVGLRPGDQFYGAGKWQRTIWEPLNIDSFSREVAKMVEELREANLLAPDWMRN